MHWRPYALAILAAFCVELVLLEKTAVLLVCWLVGVVSLPVGIARCWHVAGSRWWAFCKRMAPVVLFLAIAGSHLALRLTFRIYRSRFDQVASQIEANQPPVTPFWIGPFHIKMAGRRDPSEYPYLATNQEPWEIDGFVPTPTGGGFNLWSCIRLDSAWSYIAED